MIVDFKFYSSFITARFLEPGTKHQNFVYLEELIYVFRGY